MNIESQNQQLSKKSPEEILTWAIESAKNPIITTSFSPFSSVLLHMTTNIKPDIPVLWVDNGYNTNATYRLVKKLHSHLNLNLHVYAPEVTTAYRDAVLGGVPHISDEADHKAFTEEVKLAPFRKAMQKLQPDMWINGVRREETEFRKSLDVLSLSQDNVIKVAPLFLWTEEKLQHYIDLHNLPNEVNYYDPTKPADDRECGLHFEI